MFREKNEVKKMLCGIVIMVVVLTIGYSFDLKLTHEEALRAIIYGVAVGSVVKLAPKAGLWMGLLLLAIMIAVVVSTVKWWLKEGDLFKELLLFLVLYALMWFPTLAAMSAVTEHLKNGFLVSLIDAIPKIVFTAACGITLANFFKFKFENLDPEESAEWKFHRGLAIVISAATGLICVIMFATAAWGGIKDGLTKKAVAGSRKAIVVENEWFEFYNSLLQEDQDEENDFNFGPNPGDLKASELDAEFRERLRHDPALGAADMAWADALLGTRFLGEFYESCKGDWAKTINKSKEAFMKDHDVYNQHLDAFYKMLAKGKTTVDHNGVMEDQMYMNPYTVDGYPDVIVMKTPDHTGKFLVYEFTIKGTGKIKVAYRTECGFQPTDVEKVMKITPEPEKPTPIPGKGKNPTPTPKGGRKVTPTPGGSKKVTPTPPEKRKVTPTPGGSKKVTPTPPEKTPPTPTTPPPSEEYKKDPEKAPKKNTEPNDDPGPGPDTNNGEGAQHSAVDQEENTDHGGSNENAVQANGDDGGNYSTRPGGETNEPSYQPPAQNDWVDNQAEGGDQNDAIDNPSTEASYDAPSDGTQVTAEEGDGYFSFDA